jgi:hypothetical protein
MYTRTLRNPQGTFAATKKLLLQAQRCNRNEVAVVIVAAAGAVAVWEVGKALFRKLGEG